MKTKRMMLSAGAALVMCLAAFWTGVSMGQEQKTNTRVYELRTYTTLPERLPALNNRFSKHTMRLFEKHGMRNEMYWIPVDDARKDNTLVYVISHESQEAAEKNWKAFQADPDWIKVREASEADGKILAKAPDRIFMRMTDYSSGR